MSIIASVRGRFWANPARPIARAAESGLTVARAWRLALPILIAAACFAAARAMFAPESDPALHLALIHGIADEWALPAHLPHLPAIIGEGGTIDAMFPYSYTPLYHIAGALLYTLFGDSGVLLINAAAAAVVAAVIYTFAGRHRPWYVATASALLVFLPTMSQSIFLRVFMEPAMLASYLAGAWCIYIASARRSVRAGMAGGVLLGLAIGVRQVALLYVAVIIVLVTLHLIDRRCWTMRRLRLELPWMTAAAAALIATALPSLLYLVHVTGTVGYADVTLPGMRTALPIDPDANAYIAGITKPEASLFEWVDLYRRTLLFNERWIPLAYQIVPLACFAAGVVHLSRRGGASRFFGRLAVAQLLIELVLFITVHASSRYVIASQMLFHAVIPVGVYAIARAIGAFGSERDVMPRRAGIALAACAVSAILAPSLFSAGYARYIGDAYTLRDFRTRSYAEAAAWLNANAPPDAIVLTPRTYTAELAFERDIAWITFYGNLWVIDAISAPEPSVAHEILTRHGVDYVLIQAPEGRYLDRMPADGIRRFLQLGRSTSPFFTLQYVTSAEGTVDGEPILAGLRIYRVNELEDTR
jgi:hypothetical protein